ncbi:NB-ARC domain-containing protein [Sphaerothrix gracilis]|uniref:NB-ARC domain-containing protein n=1 Tax=Sphaerothrix gracilis TaxID=3151835 RepID=UPI0031FBF104
MSRSPKRYRGVVLTQQGIDRLETAIAMAQDEEKYGKRFTQAELVERTDLSIKTIKKIRDRTAPVDETSVRTLFEAFGLELETADYGLPELSTLVADHNSLLKERPSTAKIDWGEKPDTAIFFGRTEELATLGQWVMQEQCRVVTLLGMGGIGKTSLTAKLADQTHERFDYVIWRSLREAPPLDEILVRLIQFLSDQQETEINLPSRLGERIIRLLHYLRKHRCLLVLDNLESILQAESTGQFRDGYEGYGELIRRIGEAEHQSCLLLTSRECPRELAPMAGDRLPVRLWSVTGIDADAGREILKAKGLELEDADTQGQELIRRYSGNPQALHLVATAIQREFLGDVDDFLEEEGAAVEDVRSLLDQHLTRLAPLERSILFWLAINREPVGLDELMEDLLPPVTKREVRSALRGLSDRYLIETVGKQFTLQNVIMEFSTDRFVERVSKELNTQQFLLFHTHAFVKATAKDYIRNNQIRLILIPISRQIKKADFFILITLEKIKIDKNISSGYSAGNLLNLIFHSSFSRLDKELDFSGLTIRQCYLNKTDHHRVSFMSSKFIKPFLNEAFKVVTSLAFSSDQKYLAMGDISGNIHLLDFGDKCFLKTLYGHSSIISSVNFSPDGKKLVSGSGDTTIRLWDLSSYSCIHDFQGHLTDTRSVVFSPDGQIIASSGDDRTVRLWNANTHACIHSFEGHKSWVHSLAFSPDGKMLASSGDDRTVRIWELETYSCIYSFEGHVSWIDSIAFSPDGKYLASGSGDTTIRLWDFSSKKCICVLRGHTQGILSISFSPNGKYLASGSGDATIRIWDLHSLSCVNTLCGHTGWIHSVIFSPDGLTVASGSGDTTVRFWDIRTSNCIHSFQGYTNQIRSIAFSPDGKTIASGGDDSKVRLWDVESLNCTRIFQGHGSWIHTTSFSPDGLTIASGSGDTSIHLWDIKSNRCSRILEGHTSGVRSVVFSPDGKYLASGSSDLSIRIWDLNSFQCLYSFQDHESRINSIAFAPRGNVLASASDDLTVRLWDVRTGACFFVFRGHKNRVRSVSFSRDGKVLASVGDDKTLFIWSVEKYKLLKKIHKHKEGIRSVAFSPDGTRIATGGDDSVVCLWDSYSYNCVNNFRGHNGLIYEVAFSPDNQKLASSDENGTICVWNVNRSACLGLSKLPKPYEGINITGASGFTEAERASMLALGAIDHSSENLSGN